MSGPTMIGSGRICTGRTSMWWLTWWSCAAPTKPPSPLPGSSRRSPRYTSASRLRSS